jgi:hypothetical protein
MGEEGKDQIYGQLGCEIDQDERAEQGKGDVVKLAKGKEKQRGEISDRRHRGVAGVAGEPRRTVL